MESQADYRAGSETLARKLVEAGTDAQRMLEWLREPPARWAQGKQARLLARVFGEQFEVKGGNATPQPQRQEPVAVLSEAEPPSPPTATDPVAAPAPHPEALSAGSPPPAELWPSAALEPPVAEPVPPRPSEPTAAAAVPGSGAVVEPKGKGQLASDRVQNPHDPEAT